jgi:hypothetical protein
MVDDPIVSIKLEFELEPSPEPMLERARRLRMDFLTQEPLTAPTSTGRTDEARRTASEGVKMEKTRI